ncbi:MAG: hypothetical protein Q9206_000320 [Seirophora lacunosa]
MDKTDKPLRQLSQVQLRLPHQALPRGYKRPPYRVNRPLLQLLTTRTGLTGLAVGGVYLRRHIHRRREARNFGVAGSRQDLETWGPGQSVHDFGAAGAASGAPANEKGKEREGVENPTAANDRKLSRRLTKGWIPGKKR